MGKSLKLRRYFYDEENTKKINGIRSRENFKYWVKNKAIALYSMKPEKKKKKRKERWGKNPNTSLFHKTLNTIVKPKIRLYS